MTASILYALIGAVGVVVGGWLTARTGKRGEYEGGIITRLETRLDKEQSEREGLQAQVEHLAAQVAKLLHRDYLWDFHATRVEDQVRQHGGEPYPRPEGLHPLKEEDA